MEPSMSRDFGGDYTDMGRDYYGPTNDLDPLEEEQRRWERYFNTYCRDRANGLTHDEAADECLSLALEFKDEYERQIELYEKAIRRVA
jgi:hypothetical protein